MSSRRSLLAGVGGAAAVVAGTEIHRTDPTESTPHDWPMARYDAAGTGHNPAASGPADDVAVRWERETDASFGGPAAPILVGDALVAVGRQAFAAYDVETGDERFVREGSYLSSPARAEASAYRTDTLAVTGREGIFGLNAGGGYEAFGLSVGTERWHAPGPAPGYRTVANPAAPAPVAVDGSVFAVVPETNRLVALDANSGRVRWRHEIGDERTSAPRRPTVGDGVVYCAGWPQYVHAVDAETGEPRWREEVDVRDVRPATATEAGLVVPARSAVTLVDPDDGSQRWTYEHAGNATDGSAAVADGRVFVTDGDDRLHAIDLGSGEEDWTAEYGRQVDPVVADGVVYVAYSWLDEVVAFDAATGDELWTESVAMGISQPVVGDGVLYVAGQDRIVALEER